MEREGSVESELRAQEHALVSALARRDVTALSRMFAPDYSFTSAAGEHWGRDRAIADFADPSLTVRRAAVDVEKVTAVQDVGVVTGRSQVDGEIGGRSLSGVFDFAHVWLRSVEGWQIVAGRTWAAGRGTDPAVDIEELQRVALEWIDAVAAGDIDRLRRLMADDRAQGVAAAIRPPDDDPAEPGRAQS